jgi:FkbM family methyltransferase
MLKLLEKAIRRLFLPLTQNITVRMPHGIAQDMRVTGAIPYTNMFKQSEPEDSFLKTLELSNATVYDVGGFLGIFSLFFAQRVKPNGTVITFEPNPMLCQLFRKTMERNRLNQVELHPVALGNVNDTTLMMVSPNQLAMGTLSKPYRQNKITGRIKYVEIRAWRLDDYADEMNLPLPDFIKIDVEGFEKEVLEGMEGLLKKKQPALFIEVHAPVDEAGLFNMLKTHAYRVFHVEQARYLKPNDGYFLQGHIYCTKSPTQ